MSKLEFILADTTHQALLKGLDEVMKQSQADPFGNFVVLIPDSKTIMAEKQYRKKRASSKKGKKNAL